MLYKPNLVIIFDPVAGMVRFINSGCWANDDNIDEMFFVFFFNQI